MAPQDNAAQTRDAAWTPGGGGGGGWLNDLPRLHKIGVYTLVLIAFMALWAGGAFSSLVALPCLVLMAASWWWELPRMDPSRFTAGWTVLTLIAIGLTIASFFTNMPIVRSGVYFVLYLTVAKLFQRARLLDSVQVLALSFLLIAAATAFNEDINFGFFFAIYVVVGVITFALHHLRSELEEGAARGARRVRQLFGRGYLALLVVLAAVIFVSSVGFFFLFPRLGFGFFATKSRDGAQQSGFSENVDLGSHGNIKSDNTVVMRIQFPEGSRPDNSMLYWRGMSFDRYNGRGWVRAIPNIERRPLRDGDWTFTIDLKLMQGSQGLPRVVQDIYLEPIGSNLMFAMPSLLQIALPEKDRGVSAMIRNRTLKTSNLGDVRYYQKNQVGYQYRAISLGAFPSATQLREITPEVTAVQLERYEKALRLPPDVSLKSYYTHLPPETDPRIKALALKITEGHTNDFDRASAIAAYLRSNYTYTTDLPDPGTEPPLDAFLFTHKRGHCEYFATAMVILARAADVPTRNVNGFLGGQWNEFDGYLAVRNADAHSWVEVFFGGYGWVTFDPTPPGATELAQQSSWYDPLLQLYDSLRFKWFKYVIEYNLETQIDLIRSAGRALGAEESTMSESNMRFTFMDALKAFRKNALPLFLLVFLTVVASVIVRLRAPKPLDRWDMLIAIGSIAGGFGLITVMWKPEANVTIQIIAAALPSLGMGWAGFRRLRPGQLGKARHTGIVRLYAQLRAVLQRYGVPVRPSQGPQDLLDAVRDARLPEQDAIRALVDRYNAVRFGGHALSSDELKVLNRSLRTITRALAEHARAARS